MESFPPSPIKDMIEDLSLEVDNSIAQIKSLLKDSQKQIDDLASHIKTLEATLTDLGVEKLEEDEIILEKSASQAEELLNGIKGLSSVIANEESSQS